MPFDVLFVPEGGKNGPVRASAGGIAEGPEGDAEIPADAELFKFFSCSEIQFYHISISFSDIIIPHPMYQKRCIGKKEPPRRFNND